MKLAFLRLALLVALSAPLVSCETSDKPKKPKPVPPSSDVSNTPWNRPRSWENGSRFGGMMPQSR